MAGDTASRDSVDFFISYTGEDEGWAEWIAWELEEAGYTVRIQKWDLVGGSNFVLEMDRAAREADRTIAVLSPAYLEAVYTKPEWAAAIRDDPEGRGRKLVPVRISECKPEGLLGPIVYLDLVGLDEDDARERLLQGLRERAKPAVAPSFPGVAGAKPDFPGESADLSANAASVQTSPTLRGGGTWVKLDDLFLQAREVHDDGATIRIVAGPNSDQARALDRLAEGRYGRKRVRLVYRDRVRDGDLAAVKRGIVASKEQVTIELERVEPVRANTLRAGTGNLSPDDLVEAGLRHLFLGEPLPTAVDRHLGFMTDTGIDTDALASAFALGNDEAEPIVRLIVSEGLVGSGNAAAVTSLELGPRKNGRRRIVLTWEEAGGWGGSASVRRRLEGEWSDPGSTS